MTTTIRRHVNNIALNPYEYMTNDEGELLGFPNNKAALKYLRDNELEIEDESDLWDNYGIELHKVKDKEFREIKKDIKNKEEENVASS